MAEWRLYDGDTLVYHFTLPEGGRLTVAYVAEGWPQPDLGGTVYDPVRGLVEMDPTNVLHCHDWMQTWVRAGLRLEYSLGTARVDLPESPPDPEAVS